MWVVPADDRNLTRTSLPMEMGVGVEPELLDFTDLFFEDSLEGRARPLADYLARFPRAEAAIAREWLRLMDVEEGTGVVTPKDEEDGEDRVGHYRLIKELGRGGQGEVWLAQDTRIARQAALKFMPQGFGLISEDKKGRFRREAEVIARLEHPGLCRIYDADVDADSPWIAMRLVEGEALSARIHRARDEDEDSRSKEVLPVKPVSKPELHRLLRFFERSARALHAAHEAGVIHRDIKPGNLMVTPEGEPVLLDFGMARGDDLGFQELTASGDIFGTPSYMAPEQVRGVAAEIDVRADVWALGVTLHEALTLERPFVGQGTADILSSVLTGKPSVPSEQNSVVTDELDVIVATALERDLDRRYPTAYELAEELRRVCEYEPIRARPAGPLLKLTRWATRHPALAASLSITFFSLVAGLVTTNYLRGKERAAREKEQVALEHALGRHLAERSRTLLETDPNTALVLGVDAMELSPHGFTRSSLISAMAGDRLHMTMSANPSHQYKEVDLSKDGAQVLMTLSGVSARIFDVEGKKVLSELEGHEAELITARFVREDKQVLTVSEDGHIIHWDRWGQRLSERRLEESLVDVAVSEIGELFAVRTESGGLLLCDGEGETPLSVPDSFAPAEMFFVNRGQLLIARTEGGSIYLWDCDGESEARQLEVSAPLTAVAVREESALIALGLEGGRVQLWDLGDSSLRAELDLSVDLVGMSFSDDGALLAAWGGSSKDQESGELAVMELPARAGAPISSRVSIEWEQPFVDVAFDPLGGRIAACFGAKEVEVFDVNDGEHLERLVDIWTFKGLMWTEDGERLVGLTPGSRAPMWFMGQRENLPSVHSHLGAPSELLVQGESALVLHENGVLVSWDIELGELTQVDSAPLKSALGVEEASDGEDSLLFGDGGVGLLRDGDLELHWSLETDRAVEFARGDQAGGVGLDSEGAAFAWFEDGSTKELGPASSAVLSKGRDWIAVGGEGRELHLHSTQRGIEPRSLSLESVSERALKGMKITHMAFHPNGGSLAVHTSTDRAVRVIDLETGAEQMFHRWTTLRGLEFSDDGSTLLLWTGRHPTARTLDVATGKPVDAMTLLKAPVIAAALSHDASFVAAGSLDGMLSVWERGTGKTYLEQDRGEDVVSAVAFRGTGDKAGVLVATRSGFLWGVPLHPLSVVKEHMPAPLAPWIADREVKLAEPFTYLPNK